MIANARMYAVSAAAAEFWRQLFLSVAKRSGVALEVIEHAPPAPIAELWERADKAAVFMCGLPYSRAVPRPQLLVAPVPAARDFNGKAEYWSEFVVRVESRYQTLADTWGTRIAFTTPESQSGFAAPLRYLSREAGPRPLYAELIAPQLTPVGAINAVVDGIADVAPIDSYALLLMSQFQPALVSQVRSIARTQARPIPPLVASNASPDALVRVFLAAHETPAMRDRMTHLLLSHFERVEPRSYDVFRAEFEETLQYWFTHRFALHVDEAFVPILGGTQ
jgi:ABC-type phosphate/phosphonate transport system substrate-binding protein